MRRFFPTRCVATLAVVVGAGLGLWAQDFPSVVVNGPLSVAGQATFSGPGTAVAILGTPGSPAYGIVDDTANSNGKKWRFGNTGADGFGSFSFWNETDGKLAMTLGASGSATFMAGLNVAGTVLWGQQAVYTYMDAVTHGRHFAYTDSSSNVLYSGGAAGLGFNNAADTVRLAQLTDSGNFGIGCSTAVAAKFHVAGGAIDRAPLGYETLMGAGTISTGDSLFVGANVRLFMTTGTAGYIGTQSAHDLILRTGYVDRMRIDTNGAVIIGSDPVGTEMLRVGGGAAVNGTIRAKEVRVENTGWGDYVFAPDYKLLSLGEVAQHIAQNRHLPGIPSAADIEKNGLGVSDMVAKQMVKIEELTLYAIQAKRERDEIAIQLNQERESTAAKLGQLQAELAEIRALLRRDAVGK